MRIIVGLGICAILLTAGAIATENPTGRPISDQIAANLYDIGKPVSDQIAGNLYGMDSCDKDWVSPSSGGTSYCGCSNVDIRRSDTGSGHTDRMEPCVTSDTCQSPTNDDFCTIEDEAIILPMSDK